jgi:hypothetical protein
MRLPGSSPAGRPAWAEGSSSPGVFQRILSTSISVSRPHRVSSSPKTQSRLVAQPSSRSCQTSRAIRPCRSSRLRRFSPRDPLQVCCTLQPVLRFAPFLSSGVIAPTHSCAVRPTPLDFPGSAVFLHTLQSFPLVVRRTASPRPLPSRRSYRPQGFSRPTSPLSRPGVATRPDPLLSWASFPFRVLPARPACRRNARPGPARARTRPSLVRPRLADLARILRGIGQSFALTGTVAATFPGLFSCTSPRANAREDTQAGPPKTSLRRMVALFLYFGFPDTAGLRCCDRPPAPVTRRAERKRRSKHRGAPRGLLRPCSPPTVQDLRTFAGCPVDVANPR